MSSASVQLPVLTLGLEFKCGFGAVHALPTAQGDADGVAFAINDNGQVAGASGECSAFHYNTLVNLQPLHALLWQNGAMIDLGNLGGTGHGFGNIALGMNNPGQVVGASDLPGDATFHAFQWTNGTGMQDLGTLPGDVSSTGLGINGAGEVVGVSLDASFNIRAFLRQSGQMMDLNSLVSAKSPWFLLLACSIDDNGRIVGLAVRKSNGEAHAFLATPRSGAANGDEAPPASTGANGPGQYSHSRFSAQLGAPR